MAMVSGQGSPHSSGHSLLCRLVQVCEVLFITRKESFVSWSRELLKLALAGYWATGLAGCTAASTSDVNHSFASLPCAIQKYFVTLLVGSFLNVILNLQKRKIWKFRLSIHVRLDTHIQLRDTIHYCSDMSPAVINRWSSHAEHSRWRASALGMNANCCSCRKSFSKINIIFCFTGWI